MTAAVVLINAAMLSRTMRVNNSDIASFGFGKRIPVMSTGQLNASNFTYFKTTSIADYFIIVITRQQKSGCQVLSPDSEEFTMSAASTDMVN